MFEIVMLYIVFKSDGHLKTPHVSIFIDPRAAILSSGQAQDFHQGFDMESTGR